MDSDGPDRVVLIVATAEWRAAIDNLEERCVRIVRAALEHSTAASWIRDGEVSILLTDDDEIRDLNARYRSRDHPTNVLSFPTLDLDRGETSAAQPPGTVLLGDIAMSLQRLVAEAEERNKPIQDHFAHLLIHGVLHLLGYDHLENEQAELMEGMEETILSELGMAAAYEAREDTDSPGALQ